MKTLISIMRGWSDQTGERYIVQLQRENGKRRWTTKC